MDLLRRDVGDDQKKLDDRVRVMRVSTVQSSTVLLEFVKAVLPTCVGAIIGLLLLRRLEQVKSEVVRRSDFNRRWAELFFDTSNTFMVSVERLLTLYCFLSGAPDPNDQLGLERQRQANDLLFILSENRFRIQRLVALARSKGPDTGAAANRVFETVAKLTQFRQGNVEEIRHQIDDFNYAARRAHAEMLSSRNVT